MKKIIFIFVLLMGFGISVIASCPLDSAKTCTTTINTGLEDSLKNKILPNNLNQITQPNSSFNNRSNLGQPNLPESINMEPAQEENTQPYNANCQFGNCLNRENAGRNSNTR
ncbi:MAG: hypothetical protein E7Z87_00780 [Cyanobacteria bacterium SIG26]|nr:hypothetical protein [Cyanobacteria bacterium SIG26]